MDLELKLERPVREPIIFDSHAHYDDAKFDGVRLELLRTLPSYGVAGVINCSVDAASAAAVVELAHTFDFCYAAVGIHPEDLPSEGAFDPQPLLHFATDRKTVAVGEIGLDYYWNRDNRDRQMAWFAAQLEWARELGLPVIVHDRDAHGDTLELLRRFKPRGVLHCFSGSAEMAKAVLDLGMYIGLGGVVTFQNARKAAEIAKLLPEDRLLLETDAPYLAPVPYRGRLCHSAHISLTAQVIADLRGVERDDLLRRTMENAKRCFDIP